MNHPRSPKFNPGLYVTGCYKHGEQWYLIAHREEDAQDPHREHSRMDIPVSDDVAGYYDANLKDLENRPTIRIRLKGKLEFVLEGEEPIPPKK